MIVDLFPEFSYIKVTNQGMVILKNKWWSFKKTTVNITDLFIDILPKKIAESCKRKGYGDTYERLFSNDIYILLQIKAYKQEINIEDYIWNKYNTLHREVPIVKVVTNIFSLDDPENRYVPVLSPLSSYFIPGIEKLLKDRRKKNVVNKISKILMKQPKALFEATRFVITGVVSYA